MGGEAGCAHVKQLQHSTILPWTLTVMRALADVQGPYYDWYLHRTAAVQSILYSTADTPNFAQRFHVNVRLGTSQFCNPLCPALSLVCVCVIPGLCLPRPPVSSSPLVIHSRVTLLAPFGSWRRSSTHSHLNWRLSLTRKVIHSGSLRWQPKITRKVIHSPIPSILQS